MAKEFSTASGMGNGERTGNGSEIRDVRRMAEEAKKQLANTDAPRRSPKGGAASRPLSGDYGPASRPLSGDFGSSSRPLSGDFGSGTPNSTKSTAGGYQPLPGPTAPGRGGGRFGGAAKLPERGESPVRNQGRVVSGSSSRDQSPHPIESHPNTPGGVANRPGLNPHGGRGYSLSDTTIPKPTVEDSPPAVRGGARGRGGGRGAARGGRTESTPVQAPTPKHQEKDKENYAQISGKKGPATFAEMGFQSKPVEDKECVIM